MAVERLSFEKDGKWIQDAIVVHIIADHIGPNGERYKFCNGELHDNESAVDLPNVRVQCQACYHASMRVVR